MLTGPFHIHQYHISLISAAPPFVMSFLVLPSFSKFLINSARRFRDRPTFRKVTLWAHPHQFPAFVQSPPCGHPIPLCHRVLFFPFHLAPVTLCEQTAIIHSYSSAFGNPSVLVTPGTHRVPVVDLDTRSHAQEQSSIHTNLTFYTYSRTIQNYRYRGVHRYNSISAGHSQGGE